MGSVRVGATRVVARADLAVRRVVGVALLGLIAACTASPVDVGMVTDVDPSLPIGEEVRPGMPSGRTSKDTAAAPMHVAEMVMEVPRTKAAADVSPVPGLPLRDRRTDPSVGQGVRAGVVTAGEIDDGLNWGAYQRYAKAARRKLGYPAMTGRAPVMARLVGADGRGAAGVSVTLRRPGAKTPFYSGVSGVDGAVMVFAPLLGGGRGDVQMRAFAPEGQQMVAARLKPGQPVEVQLPFAANWSPDFLDLVLVVDTTGSMGDELAWLAAEAEGVVARAARSAMGVDIRFGLVTYRDVGDAYVARRYGFTRSPSMMTGWLLSERADGGGDREEASHVALAAAADMPWRRGRGERILIHIGDAPPHKKDGVAYNTAVEALVRAQVQVFGLAASGAGADTEFMMRQAAVVSGGRYMFLTDDSGVGNAHDEPTVACYQVTALKGMLERLLASELSGRRIEAAPREVVREVGVYRRGVCLT